MTSGPSRAVGTIDLVLAGAAMAWGVALILVALFAPFYSSETVTSAGQTIEAPSRTLVAVNGDGVLGVVAAPLAVSIVVTMLLVLLPTRTWARRTAWVLTAMLGLVTLAGMLTVGPFMVPVAALLVIMCVRAEGRARARALPVAPPPAGPPAIR